MSCWLPESRSFFITTTGCCAAWLIDWGSWAGEDAERECTTLTPVWPWPPTTDCTIGPNAPPLLDKVKSRLPSRVWAVACLGSGGRKKDAEACGFWRSSTAVSCRYCWRHWREPLVPSCCLRVHAPPACHATPCEQEAEPWQDGVQILIIEVIILYTSLRAVAKWLKA